MPAVLLKRALLFVHRWLGVGLSVLMFVWFVSGIVMMYWGFPEISERDRLARAGVLDSSRITLAPEQAFARLGLATAEAVSTLTLGSFDGRPVYRIDLGRRTATVYADDGTGQIRVDEAMIERAAARWAGRPAREARQESVREVDQWTVAGRLRTLRPLHKFSWPDGQQVYVDGNTAEVVQYTTTASRFWAYLGAIPHWLYFTPLRKHQPRWSGVVIWSSLVGTLGALIGIAIIVWMYSPRLRYRHQGRATAVPYRGWKRWHAIAGLLFGVVTTTWTFSGLLSMGPFPIVNRVASWTVPDARGGESDPPDLARALKGDAPALKAFAERTPGQAIASVSDFEVKQLELASFAGAPMYLASNGRGETRIIPLDGPPRAEIGAESIMRVVRDTAGARLGELRILDQYDAYYLDRRRGLPLPVVYVRLNDASGHRYYIDTRTGRIAGTYNARDWIDRWLYHSLHSLDFPWLYRYPPLWDIVVIALMLGGTALCLTSLVLTWRVLSRTLARLFRAGLNEPDEDLVLDAKS